ncbi:TPA: hypothetical protein ACWQ2B_004656, partial [Escherichia coli]
LLNQESRLPPGSDFRRWVWITIAPFVTIRRSGNNNRGFTMAIYSALPDLAIGLSSPLLGFISLSGNTGDVYLLGAYAAALAVPVTIFLSKKK